MKEPRFGDRAGGRGRACRRPRGRSATRPMAVRSPTGNGRRAMPHGVSRGTPSTTRGRWRTDRSPPDAHGGWNRARRPIPAGSRSRSRPSRSPRPESARRLAAPGRPCRPLTSTASLPSGRRTSGWWANVGGVVRPSSPPEPDLARRGVEQVPAADDEVDTLSQRRRRRRRSRTSSCRGGRGSADRRLARRRPRTGRPARPSRTRARRRAPPAGWVRSPCDRDNRPGSRHPTTRDRSRPPTPRTSSASSRSRRPVRRPGGASRAARYVAPASGSDLADRTEIRRNPSQSRSSSSAASNSGRDRWRSWSSIRSRTRAPRDAARPQVQTAFATCPRWR